MNELLTLNAFKSYNPDIQLYLCNSFHYPTLALASISAIADPKMKMLALTSISNIGTGSGKDKSNQGAPFKKGWLKKEGHLVKNWKDRHFIVDNGILIYYSQDNYINERGRLLLSDYFCVYSTSTCKFELMDHTPRGKHFKLEAENMNEVLEWRRAFKENGIGWEQISP